VGGGGDGGEEGCGGVVSGRGVGMMRFGDVIEVQRDLDSYLVIWICHSNVP
jgi:hypothetical protein